MSYSYSSDQFYKEWRFLIDKDFVKPSGEPFEYAAGGLQAWDDELLKIIFPTDAKTRGSKSAAFSYDGKYVATVAGFDINIHDLAEAGHKFTLKGHISQVDDLAFRPGKSTQLVSVAMNTYGGTKPAEPQIIFWDLATHVPNSLVLPEAIERFSRNAANALLADMKLVSSAVEISASDQTMLAEALREPITQYVTTKGVVDYTKLKGRLLPNFQGQIFSPSGDLMFYMPGNRPKSNGDDDWELRLYSIDQKRDALVLSGHRDAIMWAGFNHDQTLIGTAAWDKTFRIWDAKNGHQIYLFKTAQQNWTGGFSPDGTRFAGTSGDDKLHVYDLSDGSEHMTFDAGKHWSRALDWHPTSRLIALGGDTAGKLFLIDVESNEAVQHRTLSTDAMKTDRKPKPRGFLTTSRVRFVDGGQKLAFFTSGDGSIEVYDLNQHSKWRFARAGTMNPPEDDTEVTSRGGFGMIVHEDIVKKRILLGSVDDDAFRLWSVPMTS